MCDLIRDIIRQLLGLKLRYW